MKNLEKASEEYADKNVTQDWGLPIEDLKKYAMEDFVAGATWYKKNSKAPEMLEMLEKISNMHPDQNPLPFIKEAQKLIKEATKL